MNPRPYAEETNVPIERSRAEIQALLTAWGCRAIGWTDHLAEGAVELGFVWVHEGYSYKVRFRIEIPNEPKLREQAKKLFPRQSWNGNEAKKAVTYVQRGLQYGAKSAHRLLLLKLKADLNAVRAGLAKAEEIFLPWLVDSRGQTVSELVLPRLQEQLALPEKVE